MGCRSGIIADGCFLLLSTMHHNRQNLGKYKAPLKSVHNVWLSLEQCKLTFMF